MKRKKLSYSVGGNVNWYSHYGEIESYHVILQSYFWEYIQKKKNGLKGCMYPNVHHSIAYNSQDMEAA